MTYVPTTMGGRATVETMLALKVCTVQRPGAKLPCLLPATGMLTLMCVHEHLHPCTLCPGCAAEARFVVASKELVCHKCSDCPEPHRCVMTEVKWEPL